MLNLFVAGRIGADAQHKTTQGGVEFCRFSVAGESGFGDNKQTIWVDVTRWGKGSEGLARVLRKGSSVAVSGEMSTREHEGKTYVQIRADKVTILGAPSGDQRGERKQSYDAPDPQGQVGGGGCDDLDSDIPF